MNFRIKKRVTTGPYLSNNSADNGIDEGRGWVVGDNITFTAGHVVYEWNRDKTTPVIRFNPNTIVYDEFNYGQSPNSLYRQNVNAAIAAATSTNPVGANTVIEANINMVAADRVLVRGGGDVNSQDAGLATFLNPNDLENIGSIFSYTSPVITRFGGPTGDSIGTFNDVDGRELGIVEFSVTARQGDSGSAYLLDLPSESHGFVVAVQSSNPGNQQTGQTFGDAIATYFSHDAWLNINTALSDGQSGNVTISEPTNLIVGSAGADAGVQGSYRADIILGRGGNDAIDDNDTTSTAWGNDQIFGGDGDDVIRLGRGNNLAHGGDIRTYGGVARTPLVLDGKDTVSFDNLETGITITLTNDPAKTDPTFKTQLEASVIDASQQPQDTDYNHAVFVSSGGSVNTLVSIENITGSRRSDTLVLDGFNAKQLATGGVGGLAFIDFGDDDTTDRTSTKTSADLIDARGLNEALVVHLDTTEQSLQAETGSLRFKNAEDVYGGDKDDILFAVGAATANRNGSLLVGGGGADQLHGEINQAHDVLIGGEGDDIIWLGAGDFAIGGEGHDTFYVTSQVALEVLKGNNAFILDFDPLKDSLMVDGTLFDGYNKTVTFQQYTGPDLPNRDVGGYWVQRVTGTSSYGLQPLVPVQRTFAEAEAGYSLYADGTLRDVSVATVNTGAGGGNIDFGRIQFVDVDLVWRQPDGTGTTSGSSNNVDSYTLNNFLNLYTGKLWSSDTEFFRRTVQVTGNSPENIDGSHLVELSGIGAILSTGQISLGSTTTSPPDASTLNPTGFESDYRNFSLSSWNDNLYRGVTVALTTSSFARNAAPSANELTRSASAQQAEQPLTFTYQGAISVTLPITQSTLRTAANQKTLEGFNFSEGTVTGFNTAMGLESSGIIPQGSTIAQSGLSNGIVSFGDSKNDTLVGTYGSDLLVGGAGNDTLSGGPSGEDLLVGGLGDDIYSIAANSYKTVITERLQSGYASGGNDILNIAVASTSVLVIAGENSQDIQIIGTTLASGGGGEGGAGLGVVVIANQLSADQNEWIEEVHFSDGVVWNRTQLIAQVQAYDGFTALTVAPLDINEDEGFGFSAGYPFRDILQRRLAYSIVSVNGGPVPDWVSIVSDQSGNPIVTGTPPRDFNGPIVIGLAAKVGTKTLTSSVTINVAPVNDAPEILDYIPDVYFDVGPVSFTVPATAFIDVDGDPLTLTAKLDDGSPLPSWLSFNGTTFSGQVPASFTQPITVQVVASDGTLSTASIFQITPVPTVNLIEGTPGTDELFGTRFADQIYGFGSADILNGLGGNDFLDGGAGNDTLDGGIGADTLIGGAGDDLYIVDDLGDVTTEQLGEGADTVNAVLSWQLGDNIENLALTGTSAINGTGNALDNIITGNSAVNILSGNAGNDTLVGGEGSDILDGGIGSDAMLGGAGDDSYVVDSISDSVTEFAGEGVDTVNTSINYALGSNVENLTLMGMANINGSGNILDNVIVGNDGNNTLDGGTGNDSLNGGLGADILIGGVGDDTLIGGDGNDIFNVALGDGFDAVSGGLGTDTVRALANNVVIGLTAISGVETITANGFTGITISGSANADILNFTGVTLTNIGSVSGGAGDDVIAGPATATIFIGGAGNDNLTGGAGADFFNVTGTNDGFDTINGGAGTDTIRAMANNTVIGLTGITAAEVVTANGFSGVTIAGSAGADTLNFTGVTLTNIGSISGGAGDDIITGPASATIFIGGAGNDILTGGAAADVFQVNGTADGFDAIVGGAGIDTIQAMANNTVIGLTSIASVEAINAGAFTGVTISGSANADTLNFTGVTLTGIGSISGGAGDDIITGTAASDTISGGIGNDTLTGGASNDIFVVTGTNDGFDAVTGGAGTDTIQAGAANTVIGLRSLATVEAITANGFANVIISGSSGNDTLNFASVTLTGIGSISGGAGDDIITGTAAAATIIGGVGNDTLTGGAGNDIFVVTGTNDGFDAVTGGAGTDTIQAGEANTIIGLRSLATIEAITANGFANVSIGGSANADTLNFASVTLTGIARIDGGAGNDSITGSTGADIIAGGADNDTLLGGAAADSLYGDIGDDILQGDAGDDVLFGGDGNDIFRYTGSAGGFDAIDGGAGSDTLTALANNTVIGLAAFSGIEAITAGAFTGVTVAGGITNDVFDFSAITLTGIVRVNGGDGNDNIIGNAAANTIWGGNGMDRLEGGDGADVLVGDAGNDTLVGGNGNDTLTGGADIDTVDYSYSSTNWTINLAATSAQAVSGSETDTIATVENVIGGSGNDIITGTTAANVLTGGAGNDRITGGTGNDGINGGLGTDIAVFAGTQATYTITTNNGVVSITDNATTTDGNDGTDTLTGIETVEFKGGIQVSLAAPLIIDLNGDGVGLISAAQSTTRFDWDGDGIADQTGWVDSNDGILVFDRNGDDIVSGGNELSFVNDRAGANSDLDGLRAFDSNGDGRFSSNDTSWSSFRIWRDANSNGISDTGELVSLEEAGIEAINLAGSAVNQAWGWGENITINTGSIVRTNGTTTVFSDVALNYQGSQRSNVGASITGSARSNPNLTTGRFGRWSRQTTLSIDTAVDEDIMDGQGSNDRVFETTANIAGSLVAALRNNRATFGGGNSHFGLHLPYNVDLFDYFADVPVNNPLGNPVQEPSAELGASLNIQVIAPVSGDTADHLLAQITQDMSTFGVKRGENDNMLRKDYSRPPMDYFA